MNLVSDNLGALLERVAVMAAEMPDVDASAGITVMRDGEAFTVASSDDRAVRLDEAQYADGDGPCLESARTGQVVNVADVDTEARWPGAIAAARREGLRSSLSVPLELHDTAVGALNVYAFDQFDFTDSSHLAMLAAFCVEASGAISLELDTNGLSTQCDHLHATMAARKVIDQAIGIIMAQNRCPADAAFATLRRASQERNLKVHALAAQIIQTVTGTAPDTDPQRRRQDGRGVDPSQLGDEPVRSRSKRCPSAADGDHDFVLSEYADTKRGFLAQVHECRCCGFIYGDHRPADKRIKHSPAGRD